MWDDQKVPYYQVWMYLDWLITCFSFAGKDWSEMNVPFLMAWHCIGFESVFNISKSIKILQLLHMKQRKHRLSAQKGIIYCAWVQSGNFIVCMEIAYGNLQNGLWLLDFTAFSNKL